MTIYGAAYYRDRDRRTRPAAIQILSLVGEIFGGIKSAVDVGCGVGTWLSVLQSQGAERVLGYEGPWLDVEYLVIPRECVEFIDLTSAESLFRVTRFDLAICLEVAEHLPGVDGSRLICGLCDLSDIVLFSAAVPGQGGADHVNEQWPKYWADLFADRGFETMDVIRPAIWEDGEIPFWYRQNTILYVAKHKLLPISRETFSTAGRPRSFVHPDAPRHPKYVGRTPGHDPR